MALTQDKRPTHKISLVTRLCIVVLILACGIGLAKLLIHFEVTVQRVDPDEALRRVAVFGVRPIQVARQWQGFGSVIASSRAAVPAQVSATVSHIPETITEGAYVTQGQLLLALDERDFVLEANAAWQAYNQATAQRQKLDIQQKSLIARLALEQEDFVLAEREHTRIRAMFDRGVSHQQDLDVSKRELIGARLALIASEELLDSLGPGKAELDAQAAQLQSQYKLAQLNLKRCRVTSPIDGYIASLDVQVGERVSVGQGIAQVVDLKQVEVPLQLPSLARADVALGSQVRLKLLNQRQLQWDTQVVGITPDDDVDQRTFTVYVQLNQTDLLVDYQLANAKPTSGLSPSDQPRASSQLLLPGMFVAGQVNSDQLHLRWVVPRRALVNGRLLVVDAGVIHYLPVTADYAIQGDFPQTGLDDRQWVVLQGFVGKHPFAVADRPYRPTTGETPVLPEVLRQSLESLKAGMLVLTQGSTSLLDGAHVEPVRIDLAADVPDSDSTAQVGLSQGITGGETSVATGEAASGATSRASGASGGEVAD